MEAEYLKLHYLEKKESIPDISKLSGISKSTIRYWIIKHNIPLRTRLEGHALAKNKMGNHLKDKKRKFTNDWIENIRKSALKRWDKKANGISLKPNGYYEITRGVNKGKSLHVVIMEINIGRKLKKNEVVHHKNEIKTDNRIENLELMTKSEHSKLHAIKRINNNTNYDISKESKKGELHNNSKLKEYDVIEIYNSTLTNKELSIKYNVSISCIKHIKNKRTWKHLKL
ncbi:MAG: HNH endonuclease signature motif containing protein [Eubacteriaceae bacterium]